ncbi:MAG: Methyltransferase type 12 [Microgenomates group bacterium GW2011_GWC1_37_8]|uniref:Methyltransferase type 12 n=1 Tax=Candidatus Woesebacteria bacterium GW2011_GWB1_38_8 TaxID=1618570 RepID=A0A0G0L2G2_9BACT|nr:MAG: Methyltransferase type 12 [Microgenomates group bacterium GW2011_GWC1_37_8]KKQ86143.1 MAG: Methyltransferase type 12 [Candidatus Woesebacteria bacterium GW2011_GWB1_38_8]
MDKVGEYTLEIMREAGWYNNWLFMLIEPELKGHILEVGAGIGNITQLLVDKSKRVYAIDLNERYVEKLKKRFANKLEVELGNVEKNDNFFNNKKFDTIVCLNVLEHIKKDTNALKNMYSLLIKGGKLILLVPAHEFLYSHLDAKLGHYKRYNKKELDLLLEDIGFKKISLKYINLASAAAWFIMLRLTKRGSLPRRNVEIFNIIGKLLIWPEKYIEPPIGLSVLAIYKK